MKALNLFSSAAAAMMLFACNETEVVNSVEPKPGQDVEFSISYKDINSRTIYEPEVNDGTGHYFPVSWLSTDQVFLMSNECNPSTGQYKVGFESGQQASAGTLVKIGDTGLQWSTASTGNFYSIYPYDKADRATADPAQRKVTVRMPHIQNDYVILDDNGNPTVEPDMEAALLYAQTNGVPNGANVNLHYYNLATALRFTFQGPTANGKEVMIREVTLIAPKGKQIAGNFNLTFADESSAGVVATAPTFTPGTADGTNSFDRVTIFSTDKDTGANLVLSSGQTVELNAFFLINEETDMTGWEIQVRTLDKLYSRSISKEASGKDLNLMPGKIHRLGTLPAFPAESTEEWDVSNWMKNIPRNTYLCEISVPGSWNTMNKDFQVEVTDDANSDGDVWDEYISTQYAKGARAFHLDTRWKRTQTGGSIFNPTYTYNGLGIAAGEGTGDNGYTTGPLLTTVLSDIKGNLKSDEFMYVICTFAQGSSEDPSGKTWEQAVSDAIAGDDAFFDGQKLTPQTTVNDVLNHIVVICNTEGATPDKLTSSKSLYINAPLTITNSDIYGSNPPYNVNNIYWGNGTAADVEMLVSQCQSQWSGSYESDGKGNNSSERGYLPSEAEREGQLNAVLNWSMDNYTGSADATGSNRMILLGIGGTTADYGWLGYNYNERGKTPITQHYGPWIYDKIQEMENHTVEHFYPVGIVLMNDVTSTANIGTGSDKTDLNGPEVMKKILLLNNLYQMQFDPNKPAWPNTNTGGGTTSTNSAENYSASHVNGGDAWTVQ